MKIFSAVRHRASTGYLRVKSSWDYYGKSRPTHIESLDKSPLDVKTLGLPDVWRYRPAVTTGKRDYVEMTANVQHYLCKINLEMQYGRYLTKDEYFAWYNNRGGGWGTMMQWMEGGFNHFRAYTNKFGMDNMANHLSGERLSLDNPKFGHIVTGRAVVKAVLENGKPMRRNLPATGDCLAFECINASGDLWQYSPHKQRHLFEQPLNTGRVIAFDKAGAYIARDDLHIPFPQFSEKMRVPIWLPYDDTAWMPVSQLQASAPVFDKVWVRG
jgi:hypothetical protein